MTPAEQFFFDNAGYSYNPETETPEQGRTRCAQRLAEAEEEADRRGWWVEWVDDGEEDGAPRWCALVCAAARQRQRGPRLSWWDRHM